MAAPPEGPLAEILEAARAAWPGIVVPADSFAAYLAERLGENALAAPQRERAVEMVLAFACSRGDAAAVQLFERSFFVEVDEAARRARAGSSVAGDARQNLLRSLFTGANPAINTFRGRGDLRGWMRVCATREVLRLVKQQKRDVLIDDDRVLDALCPPTDPELGHLRVKFRGELVAAFSRAIASLSDEQRGLLRRQLDGVTIDVLAAERGVHRATAARWLAEARTAVHERTRSELARGLGTASTEAESIMRLLSSRLDVSLDRLLGG